MNRSVIVLLASILVVLACARVGSAQNPVQWGGNTSQAVDRAAEQSLPLLFWVTNGRNNNDDDLSDAHRRSVSATRRWSGSFNGALCRCGSAAIAT